jgi:DNA-binding PadR family transcriptional regulator
MPAQETEKLPKTALILGHIAEHGPKTEYDLYSELPGVSHGTIHFCLKNLTEHGALMLIPSRKREKRPKKLYNLTFVGTVTYLASFFPRPEIGIAKGEEAEYWENFEDEIQSEILEFLEKQGRLQKYVPFQEIRWLRDHFPGIVRGFVIVANTICSHPPSAYKKPLVFLLFQAMRKENSEKEATDEKKHLTYRVEEAFREEFTDLFFQLLCFMKAKGRTNNYKLRQLAEERLEDRRHETVELEQAIELFSKKRSAP